MNKVATAGLVLCACMGLSLFAGQDWYHDRLERFRGEQWRGHLFEQVRADLDHLPSSAFAANRERTRLQRTRQELSDLQGKLQAGRYDEHELSDVMDSIQKSANDERLSPRDREVLRDDLNRLRDYREHHDHWNR